MKVASISVGAILLIAAAAGFVIVPEHKPHTVTTYREVLENPAGPTPGALSCASGYCKVKVRTHIEPSRTLYDALRITTWALLIVGLLLVIMGLMAYGRRPRPGRAR